MIEGTPQLYTDLILRYEDNALQKSDLEYVEYFLHLFERYLTFELIDLSDESTAIKSKRLKSDLSVRTNTGIYMDENDLIYFLQIKLNQIMKDFEKIMPIDPENSNAGYKPLQDLKLLDVHKTAPSEFRQGQPHNLKRDVEYAYQILYNQCSHNRHNINHYYESNARQWNKPGYYFYDALSPIDNALYPIDGRSIVMENSWYVKGMVGEFKYKFDKIKDIRRFIDHIAVFLKTKDKWS